MKKALQSISGAALAIALVTVSTALAGAQSNHGRWQYRDKGPRNVVFVQTDNLTANEVVAYYRNPDGTLTLARPTRPGALAASSAVRP